MKTTDAAIAKSRLKDLTEPAASLAKGGDTKATFNDISYRWLKMAAMTMKPSSAERQTGVMQSLSKYFGSVQIRKLTKTMVEDWAAERSKEIAARTYNYERESMVRMLDYAQREGMILENPARILKRLKVQQTKPVIPTKHEFEILISEIREMRSDAHAAADLCELLAYSGCRLLEDT